MVVPGIVLAQDPTDITNWPACAQRCIPKGYSVCSSLADLNCICKNGDFTLALADCEQSTCLLSEIYEITKLTTQLCAPVGGLAPAVYGAASTFFATYTARLPSTPVIVAPTPAPDLGNVSDLNNYPKCDQACAYKARAAIKSCDTTDKACICAPEFRSMTAACTLLNCDALDIIRTDALDDQFCGPYYVHNVSLSSSVAAAIASATRSVRASVSARASVSVSVPPASGNASVTAPTPAAFTGQAGRASAALGGVVGVVGLVGGLVLGL
ncbi:MAG: hypothetical protein HETSPECPRED_001129 [Heterodermia speciosa]|uniref:CFEM domain-containing protein n=1 Tax=Heterodermia speciosa TaxID=116794 RepID=A0A8H3PE23_9LECA|nr:MAG: hypothetical protein HETSPECPRED_001129 [Heterodermia speciosa]